MPEDYRSPYEINPEDIKTRKCLKCNVEFKSMGKGNRICDRCTRVNVHLAKKNPIAQLNSPQGRTTSE